MKNRCPNAVPLPLPRLTTWLLERGLSARDAAESLNVTPQAVRRYCLPFGHRDRQIPRGDIMSRIHKWTGGQVGPADFYPPELSQANENSAKTVEVEP